MERIGSGALARERVARKAKRAVITCLAIVCLSGTAWAGSGLVMKILRITASGAGDATMIVPKGETATLTVTADDGSQATLSVDEDGKVESTGGFTDIMVSEEDFQADETGRE